MALDIEKLRLTYKETGEFYGYLATLSKKVAVAQLAKALWGIVDWLWEQSDMGHHIVDQHPAAIAVRNLSYYAEKAGIERPKVKHVRKD